MKLIFSLFILVVCAWQVQGQTTTIGNKESLLPPNWTVFKEAKGDLNKDGLDDLAIIVESSVANEDGEKPRALRILLKNNKVDNTYTLEGRSDKVIYGAESGGMLGDPFAGMEIKNNVLEIDFYGGAREKWATTHRYWYRANDRAFYVIGATFSNISDETTETFDYNLFTGNIVVTKEDSNKVNKKVTNLMHKIVLPDLAMFDPEGVWAILMPQYRIKTSSCILQDVRNTDCIHVIFDCGDFGNALPYLDEASDAMWRDLISEDEPGEMKVNPKYKGKTFEITYAENTGASCPPESKAKYQLVTGFKLKN
ncbi:MAG TPA: hypothetical protein VL728_17030 [Cyclobacteriaceae bacterium]|nr:hypothetical protein [Cyclobacteriaceae bacterium]